VTWISSVGLDDELEARESAIIRAPLSKLSEREVINASWEGEGMATLAWALSCYDLPAYDQIVSSPSVGESLGFLNELSGTVLDSPRLRPAEEVDEFREQMFALHWRLREFSLRPEFLDFARFACECSFGPLDIARLPLVRGDLAIDGRTLMDVGEDRWGECLSISSERHRTANWLAGHKPIYSQVTADT
jgi:hypothetical protein